VAGVLARSKYLAMSAVPPSGRLTVLLKRIPSMVADLLTGIPSEFTPAQKARLDEMERDHQELIRLNPAFALTRRAAP
jgi:hypothetical protein